MLDEIFARTLAAFPDSADTINRICQVRREAFGRPYEEFFEPKSAFDAHPNNRGMLGFMRSAELPPVGWRIRYSPTEEVRTDDRRMVLGLLLEMMRLGYSASEFLRLGTVSEVGDGFSIAPPEPELMKRVLKKLMLLEDAPEAGLVM